MYLWEKRSATPVSNCWREEVGRVSLFNQTELLGWGGAWERRGQNSFWSFGAALTAPSRSFGTGYLLNISGAWGTSAGWEQWPRAFPRDRLHCSEVSTSVTTNKQNNNEVQVVKRWESWKTELNTAQENLVGAAELNTCCSPGKFTDQESKPSLGWWAVSCFARVLKFGFHVAGTF